MGPFSTTRKLTSDEFINDKPNNTSIKTIYIRGHFKCEIYNKTLSNNDISRRRHRFYNRITRLICKTKTDII